MPLAPRVRRSVLVVSACVLALATWALLRAVPEPIEDAVATAETGSQVPTVLEASGPAPPAASDAHRTDLGVVEPAGPRTRRIQGRVLGPDHRPAAGAAVWCTVSTDPASAVPAWTIARDDGTFELPLTLTEFLLHASGSDCGESTRALADLADVDLVRIDDLLLPPGGTIRGRLLDVLGAGLDGVPVEAWAKSGAVWSSSVAGHRLDVGFRKTATDREGRFELAGLRGVPHDVLPRIEGWQCKWNRVRADAVLPDGEELEFRQLADGVLRGHVVDAATRAPITEFLVNEQPRRDADGRFETPFTEGGGVFVEAEGYDADVWIAKPNRVQTAEVTHEFELEHLPPPPDGSLVVRAVDERGEPVAGIRVRPEWGKLPERWVHSHYFAERDTVQSPGETRIRGLASAPRALLVDAPGHACVSIELRFEAGRENLVECTLERGATARIRVRDDYGLVARDCELEIDSVRRKERKALWTVPRATGGPVFRTDSGERIAVPRVEGELRGLPAGRYTLLVHVDDERSESFELEVDAEEERAFDFRLGGRR